MTVDREKIIRVILTTTLEDGSFPESISREIEKEGIEPNEIFKAYLINQYSKEPTRFLSENADKLKLDDNVLDLLVDRIRKNPKMSSEVREIFYHKDKNFYILFMDRIVELFRDQLLSEDEESNLLYFLEENKIRV